MSRLWISFSSLASLGFPQGRAQALAEHPPQTAAPRSGEQPVPDEQLMCFDFMYYIGAAKHDEWWAEWSPAWRLIGQHARWAPKLEQLALRHIRRALDLDEDDEGVPPVCPPPARACHGWKAHGVLVYRGARAPGRFYRRVRDVGG